AAERKILLACGAAAGMAATFGAPLASVVLAIELLLFEFSTRAFLPLVVAASIAAGVHHSVIGDGPLFAVPEHDVAGLGQLPLFAALGVGCGLLAVVVARGLFAVEAGVRRLPVPSFWEPVLGSLRSEEHTSELQSRENLVCRLLLEKKNKMKGAVMG